MDDPSYLSSLFAAVEVYPLTASSIIAIILAICFLLLSGFYSGAEVALFSLKSTDLNKLETSSSHNDRKILDLRTNSDLLIGTILIWDNFSNISITMLISYVIGNTFDFSSAPTLGFIIQVIGITFLILMVGEILPKVYFQNHALQASRAMIKPISWLTKISTPLAKGLVKIGDVVTRPMTNSESKVTDSDLERAIELTTDDPEEQDLLHGIVRFHRKTVSEVMTPRMDIAALEDDLSYDEVKAFITDKGYSRMPVYEERIDDIKGVLYAKDLLPHLSEEDNFEWQGMIREAFFVPESKRVNSLLQEFRQQKIHMAIVVDEFGGTSGLVTMEDLLEEIVGEIEDEYDEEEDVLYTEEPDGSYIFDAKIPIVDFLKIVSINSYEAIQEQMEEVDTLGGLLLETKGDFPTAGEEIMIDVYRFVVREMGHRRISKIQFFPDRIEEGEQD